MPIILARVLKKEVKGKGANLIVEDDLDNIFCIQIRAGNVTKLVEVDVGTFAKITYKNQVSEYRKNEETHRINNLILTEIERIR